MKLKLGLLASVGAVMATAGVGLAQDGGYPADAQPGQCFARVLIPEVSNTASEQVVDQAARTEIRVIPAQYQMVDEQVLVREASVEYRVVPATYRTVTETVVVEPERTEEIATPASVETYEERVMVRPAYTTWKPGSGIYGRPGAGVGAGAASVPGGNGSEVHTGELLCRVEVPAEYTTVTRTRTAQAASVQTRTIPARTQQITREVVATPARVDERPIPAEYRTIKVRRMVEPARQETITIPATYRTVERRVVTRTAGVEWREVLCETNASPAMIRDVQQALNARGFTTSVDGQFGPSTLNAMERFQRANGLPVGYLTVDTVRALGLSMPNRAPAPR
jgi:Putative peptidoglycan binding domain